LALGLIAQWWWVHFAAGEQNVVVVAASAGLAIFGAAFVLSWAAEAAQVDIPQSVAVVLIALLAVLPEYAVDIYFAWQAGQDPTYTAYATANMTGANRILIGLGWPVIVFAYRYKGGLWGFDLEKSGRNELFFLLAATLYSFTIPLSGSLGLFDMAVLVGLFICYISVVVRQEIVEPELEGVAEYIAAFSPLMRRSAVVTMFAIAGITIFISAQPLAESLLSIGRSYGLEEFLLVQWLAPLASETPEFVVATVFALRCKPGLGFSALLSSKVNQWTLLIGMLPLAFTVSAAAAAPMPLDARQRGEILLTSAQSLFAIAIVADLHFSVREAVALLVLFVAQFIWSSPDAHMTFVWLYIGATVAMLVTRADLRRHMWELITVSPWQR